MESSSPPFRSEPLPPAAARASLHSLPGAVALLMGWSRQAAAQLGHTLRLWLQRARGRRELARLDDRMLRDIGVPPMAARRELDKWMWQA